MAINGTDINGVEVNGEGDNDFNVFLDGFTSTVLDGMFVFRDVDMVADFYKRPEIENSKGREITDYESPPPGDEP